MAELKGNFTIEFNRGNASLEFCEYDICSLDSLRKLRAMSDKEFKKFLAIYDMECDSLTVDNMLENFNKYHFYEDFGFKELGRMFLKRLKLEEKGVPMQVIRSIDLEKLVDEYDGFWFTHEGIIVHEAYDYDGFDIWKD